ncbi:MAG: zinc-dependent metalloprotease family protein [Patescibacteria group bacterium]
MKKQILVTLAFVSVFLTSTFIGTALEHSFNLLGRLSGDQPTDQLAAAAQPSSVSQPIVEVETAASAKLAAASRSLSLVSALNQQITAKINQLAPTELKSLLVQRKVEMINLAKNNPRLFLTQKLSPATIQKIPPALRPNLEQSVTLTGRLKVIHSDDFEHPENSHFDYLLVVGNEKYALYPTQPINSASRAVLAVSGLRLDKILVVESEKAGQLRILTSAPPPYAVGEQETAVILVNFQDNPVEPTTKEDTRIITFDDSNSQIDSLNDWIIEASYNKTWLTGDVYGWYTLPYNDGTLCELDSLLNAIIPLSDSNIYFPSYKRLIIVFPNNDCLYKGVAYIGSTTISTKDGESVISYLALNGIDKINGGTGSHELGHNFGLNHANLLKCENSVITGECVSKAYGDLFDNMGWAVGRGHFNAYHKETIGWLNASNILETSNTGVYAISPIETKSSDIMALKIPTPQQFFYYLEFRRPLGYDLVNYDVYGNDVYNGVFMHINLYDNGGDTQLLDTSIDTGGQDVVLRPGEVFYDPHNNLTITTVSVTDENAKVMISRPICGDGIIEGREQCEVNNLNQNTCQSLGYRTGNLGCTSACTFNTLLCSSQICRATDIYLGDDKCTAIIRVDTKDGSLQNFSFSDNWNELRHSPTAQYVVDTTVNYFSNNYFPSDELGVIQENIDRVSLPFNTSFPTNALLTSAALNINVYPASVINTHPNSTDFVVLVPASLKNPPALNIEDFDQFGSIDNPLELSNRFDISQELGPEGKMSLNLNQEGIKYINKKGFTIFGMRGGYDLNNETPNRGEDTNLSLQFSGAGSIYGGSKLIINYTIPSHNTVTPPPSIPAQPLPFTVMNPNGGESWKLGTKQIVSWGGGSGAVNVSAVKATATSTSYLIGKQITGSSFSWTVGQGSEAGVSVPAGTYRLRVCTVITPTTCDESDAAFTIVK